MALAQSDCPEHEPLPPLDEVIVLHDFAVGDVIMFAAMGPEARAESRWDTLRDVLEPYVLAGALAVEHTEGGRAVEPTVPHLTLVSQSG